ncbi:dipeptidyl peptidase 4 isoform X3 [Harmonia axyridis]|uniref:dipeptidyl peptidase 4 isoform X3 n=1 Tax=Harmonia axyridis TaxID=115357 RepID=UPI001E276F1B|nr:dipeptidyl peptidase 4 isoform X3 [Harmonia axyridis]XP_045472395.1 dipeptidyl peptidase 4 isoform X3 [Harmonia axyridis]
MHSASTADRSSWRIPPDETLQVADPKAKKAEVGDEEVSTRLQELALQDDEGHNWWSIIFSLLVIGLVISGIVAAIFFVGYVDELLYWHGRRMQLEEYLQGDLNPRRLPSSWISSTHFVFQSDDGSLAVLEMGNNITVSVLVTNHTLRQLNVKGYQCSRDLKYVLFQHNVKTYPCFDDYYHLEHNKKHINRIKSVFRQSFTAHYTIYDVEKDHHIPLRLEHSPKTQPERLQYAKWLGSTNSIIIVYNNDIYLRESPLYENDNRLTFTGKSDIVYNGIPDWLYQEDILRNPEALWTSRDNTHILYASFNDSEVGLLNFPWFSTAPVLAGKSTHKPSFPNYRTVRYPTPGSNNPKVELYILDITNITDLQRYQVIPPKALVGQDYYLTSAGWIGQKNTHLSVVWMNRAQNLSIVSSCLSPNWTCIDIHTERAFEHSWLEIQEQPTFSPDGDSFLVLAQVREGNTGTFTHIKHVIVTRQHIAVLGHGRHEVDRILSWDPFANLIYYLATEENKPGQRHLFVVRDPTTDDPRRLESQCITCDLSDVLWSSRYLYGNCTHFNALVSPRTDSSSHSYYVLQCEGPGLPLAGVHNATSHRLLKVLYDTRITHLPRLQELALPKQKFLEVPLPQGNRAQVQMLLPPSWREELRDAAYPVLVEVNGRPGSKSVTDEYEVDWGTYMSSHSDVVYVKLDVRGACGLSDKALYHQLGGVEVQDQMSVLQYLFEKYKYLDKTRVGLWGWGYGGYVTTMVLGLGNQQKVYKCGVAVSPIADWLFYNSAFTERILGLPTDNYKGYVEADATQRAKNIPRKSFFLIHGLADLTTPYQHGVQLARALTDAGILFRYQSYADEGHELRGVLEHVYRSMQEFFEECLSLDSDESSKDREADT